MTLRRLSAVLPWTRRSRPRANDTASTDAKLAVVLQIMERLLREDPKRLNVLVLSGVAIDPPAPLPAVEEKGVSSVGLLFDHGDAAGGKSAFSRSLVEIPEPALASYPGEIEEGHNLMIVGKVGGAGGILASLVVPANGHGSRRRQGDIGGRP